jgi:hypothetical protein
LDVSHPDFSLRALCDKGPIKPEQITQPFLDHFGIEILANSPNLIFPVLSPYNEAADVQFMESHQFTSYDGLRQGIAGRPTDLDKLLCIFYWAAHNVRYDVRELFGRRRLHERRCEMRGRRVETAEMAGI